MTRQTVEDAVATFNKMEGSVPSYTESTGYDLLYEGNRYPPKAIFGLALSSIVRMPVLSKHFTGGSDSNCFKILERLNFDIVTKPRPSTSDGLSIYREYTREQLSQIFDPDLTFTTGSGRWGGSGIVPNVPIEDDFAFIVTLEDQKKYEDYLTEDGVLCWKSQEQHTPSHKWIKTLNRHDAGRNMVYLFMRVNKGDPYTYFGPLALKMMDINTSNPVHFQWDLIAWPLPETVRKKFSKFIRKALNPNYHHQPLINLALEEVSRPKKQKPHSRNQNDRASRGSIEVDWATRDQNNRDVGLAGELLVIQYEKNRLERAGRKDLACRVEHVAQLDSAAGYDIASYEEDGTPRFIEVKTTKGAKSTPFYISRNEVEVSATLGSQYWIYRLYGLQSSEQKTLKFYKIQGRVEDNFDLVAESYRAFVK